MGSKARRAYTALGDTVNTAARFCGAAGPTQILVGQRTYDLCKDYMAVDLAPGMQLKGKSAEKFTIYRVTAIREAPGQPWATAPGLETYAEVGIYQQQTMIGAGATVAMDADGSTGENSQNETKEFQPGEAVPGIVQPAIFVARPLGAQESIWFSRLLLEFEPAGHSLGDSASNEPVSGGFSNAAVKKVPNAAAAIPAMSGKPLTKAARND